MSPEVDNRDPVPAQAAGTGASHPLVATCPNCEAPNNGPYCHQCGQNQKRVDRFFLSLVGEFFEDVFAWNSRTARTLFALLFRPAFLTREYFAGRRARYIPPLRLYLITSVSFFFLASMLGHIGPAAPDAADTSLVTNDDGSTEGTWQDELRESVNSIQLDSLSDTQNQQLGERLQRQLEKVIRISEEDPAALLDQFIEAAPPVLFVLLPIFAVLLKIVYISSGKYYTEHLVLALHNHSFLFIVLIMDALLERLPGAGLLSGALGLWIPTYMYLSLRGIYGQGYFTTFLNFVILGIMYLILLSTGAVIAFIAGVMTL
ncbi:MAG: DUF3667 domain-containing protein [Pseudomonadota bacterium]